MARYWMGAYYDVEVGVCVPYQEIWNEKKIAGG